MYNYIKLYIYIHAYIDACWLMFRGYNSIFHFLSNMCSFEQSHIVHGRIFLSAVCHTNPHTHCGQSDTTVSTSDHMNTRHQLRLLRMHSRSLLSPHCSVVMQPKPLVAIAQYAVGIYKTAGFGAVMLATME